MSSQIINAHGILITLISGMAGGKVMAEVGHTLQGVPQWAEWLLGPFGALLGTVAAMVWLLKRLQKAEDREATRQVERDENMRTVVSLTLQTHEVIRQNSQVITELKDSQETKI